MNHSFSHVRCRTWLSSWVWHGLCEISRITACHRGSCEMTDVRHLTHERSFLRARSAFSLWMCSMRMRLFLNTLPLALRYRLWYLHKKWDIYSAVNTTTGFTCYTVFNKTMHLQLLTIPTGQTEKPARLVLGFLLPLRCIHVLNYPSKRTCQLIFITGEVLLSITRACTGRGRWSAVSELHPVLR